MSWLRSVGGFDATLLAGVRVRFVREAVVATAVVGGGVAVVTLVAGTAHMWPIVVGAAIVFAVGVVQLVMDRPSPPGLIAAAAISIAAVAPWVEHDVTPSLIAAVLLAGVVVFVVFERPLRALAGVGGLVAVMGYASWLVNPGVSGWIGFMPLVAATFVSWSMLTALRRKLVERSEEVQKRDRMYRDLFNRVSAGLYRTTPDGRFLQANEAFRQMLAIPHDRDIRDVSVEELYVGYETRGELLAIVDSNDGVTTHEMPVRRADGVEIWVRDRTLPIFAEDGTVLYYDGDLQDITEERRAERELRAQVHSKSELIAAVSHELRTPLTAILGFLDVLADDGELSSQERIDLVRIALEQASDMSALVEDLLTAARIENDELVMAVEPLRVVDAVDAVDAVVATVAPSADIRVRIGDDVTVDADPVRLRQILRNLVTNAVRHGAPPIEVRCETGNGGAADIIVADAGPGVAPDVTERIFEAFFRGYDAENRPGSIGLGLAVSRRLARLMGGELSYRRGPGETRFVLRIPLAAASSEAA